MGHSSNDSLDLVGVVSKTQFVVFLLTFVVVQATVVQGFDSTTVCLIILDSDVEGLEVVEALRGSSAWLQSMVL